MKACNRVLQSACVLLVLLLGLNTASSQGRVQDYVVTNFSGGFNSIINTGNVWYQYDCFTGSYGISMPFAFNYDKTAISAGSVIYATSFGAIALGSTLPPAWSASVQGNQNYPALLNFMEAAMCTGHQHWGNPDYRHAWQVQGSSPNRVLVIEMRTVHNIGAAGGQGNGPSSYSTDVQIKLYETTNVIEYVYSQPGRYMGNQYYYYPSIGLNGYKTPSFSSKLVASSVSTVPSQNYRFTPPPPPAQLSLQPKTLAFGNVTAGSPTTLCATIKSTGSNPLVFQAASISGTADYTITSAPAIGTQILPGNTAQICVTFNPLASGSRNSILTVTTNGADSGTQQVNLTGIGIAPSINVPVLDYYRKTKVTVGDTVNAIIAIQSTGTGPLKINSVTFGGGNPDQYTLVKAPAAPIPVGQWDSIYISYRPTFEGRHDATVLINSNAINIPIVTARVLGIAIMPRLSVTPLALNFDSVRLGETSCKNITLSNPGTDTVNILKVIRTFSDADYSFTPLNPGDSMIRPEETRAYIVCFTPTHVGTRVANLRFYSDIRRTIPDGRDTSQFIVNIIGVGVPTGSLTLSGDMVDSAVVGIENCVTDVITNNGTADFTVMSASISGANASEYSFKGLSFPFTLKAGETRSVTYCLTPTDRGIREGSLVLSGSSADQVVTATLPLSGVGLAVCANSDPMSAFSTMTPVGMTDSVAILVTNCGDLATTYTSVLGSGSTAYTVLGAGTSGVVAPGESTTFNVAYTPTTVGANASTLTITGNGIGSVPMVVDLGGVGAGVVANGTGGNAGTVQVNDCVDFTVTLTNNGNVDWTPGTPQFTGADASEFTFLSLTPETITAGGTGAMALRYCPKNEGNSSASFNFPSSAPAPVGGFAYSVSGLASGVKGVSTQAASKGFVLEQTYPNPMMNSADFRLVTPKESLVRVDLFDAAGAFVRTLVNERIGGERTVSVDATTLTSGTYNYVLTSGDVRLVRQLTIVH
jgi:hypothetical protein